MGMIATQPETAERLMTVEEFLALPDNDGVDRMLIQGRLWEKPFRFHDPRHAAVSASVAAYVGRWVHSQPEPRGQVFARGGFILREAPASVVGIDVAYATNEIVSRNHPRTEMIEGCPVLAVEILAPGDTHGEIVARVREYLAVGISLIWSIEPVLKTVTVYSPDRPRLFSGPNVLSGGDAMPGFEITVNQIFED